RGTLGNEYLLSILWRSTTSEMRATCAARDRLHFRQLLGEFVLKSILCLFRSQSLNQVFI
ncbi:hypothetical protein, partial [Autumnicola edwardsiae]